MSKHGLSVVLLAAALVLPVPAAAVSLEVQDARLAVNGYLDLQYTYMDRMPMASGATVVPMDAVSTLDQDHLNLIFQVARDRVVANVNLQSRRAFQSGVAPDDHGEWEVLEAYGEYQFSDRLRVRGGELLAPFGFYNHMRYAIALFSPVVLPTFYEPPANYGASGGLDHLVPDAVNLMVHGAVETAGPRVEYAAYVGSGHRGASGADANEGKNVGAKVAVRDGDRAAEVSAYWANDGDAFGDRLHLAAGLQLGFGRVAFQGEVLDISTSTGAADVLSYYGRIDYRMERTTPFVGYDYLEDDANLIYRGGMHRWSAGVGHELSPSVFLKAEYHHHVYGGAAVPASVEHVDMVRLAAILVF